MTNDLISRSALTDAIVDLLVFEWGYEGVEASVKRIFSEIPTVDAVAVCRCKDCKHSYKGSPHGLMCECPVGGQNTSLLGGDDFCSNGERRENHDE